MKLHLKIISLFLISNLFFQGCKTSMTPSQASITPTTQVIRTIFSDKGNQVQTASPITPTPWKPTITPTTIVSLTPTKRPTNTATAPHTATFTPLPTLDNRGILGLIDTNGGCQLPCWWGIEPGNTTSEQARAFLKTFSTALTVDGEAGFSELDGKVRFDVGYIVEYDLPGSSGQGEFRFEVWDETVVRIYVGPATTQYRYTLDQLLTKMGKPTQVFLEAKHDAMGTTIPFDLILYYPNRRFFAGYPIKAVETGDRIRACPAKVAPGLIMWAPEYQIESRLADEMLGPDARPGLQTLEDATGLSIDDFYAIFRQTGFSACLESPLIFWENLK
jgi:hypothetical protein